VEAELDIVGGYRGRLEPALGAEHSHFFAVPKGEEDGAARVDLRFGECFDRFQEGGDAAGVVVGAVINDAGGAGWVAPAGGADVVVVGADDNEFVLELGIGAGERNEDAAAATVARIVVLVGAGGLKARLAELFDYILCRGASAASAHAAAFEYVVGKGFDV